MENKINVKIKQCYDTEENYKNNNPILLEGQLAYTKDKYGKYKVGDGISHWNDLDYTENIFIGTQKEYEEKNANGEITPGTVVYITDDNDYYNIPVDDYMSEENEHVVYNKTITKALRLNNASENYISSEICPIESVNNNYQCTLPASGAISNVTNLGEWLSSHRSGFYTMQISVVWYNVVSNRHRNGISDGNIHGMTIYSKLTDATADLLWDRQNGVKWQGQRTILDNVNYSDFIITLNKSVTIKGDLNVSGRIVNKGSYVSEQSGTSGTVGLVHFMRIVVKGSYVNYPISLEMGGRGWHPCYLTIRFQSTSSSNPGMDSIYKFGDMGYNIYYYKSGTSTWDFYANKNEAYGRIDIKRLHNPIPSSLVITFPNIHVGNVNSAWSTVGIGAEIRRSWYVRDSYNGNDVTFAYGNTGLGQGSYSWLAGWNGYELRAVSRDHFLGAKSANGYWGMAQPNGADNVWIRTTNQGIIPYQSGGRGGGHQGLGTSSWYFSNSYIDNMYGVHLDLSGRITASTSTGTHINGAKGTNVGLNCTAGAGYNMLSRVKSSNGVFTMGCYNTSYDLYYIADSLINANTNSYTKMVRLLNQDGNSSFPGTVSALTFSGKLSGNVSGDRFTYTTGYINSSLIFGDISVNRPYSNELHIRYKNQDTVGLQIHNYNNDVKTYFQPARDNGGACGTTDHRWTQICCVNSSISTSDIRRKREISIIGKETEYEDTIMSDETLINLNYS